jgi:biotin carboxylase
VLHSEWILVDGEQPHLVECAARMPGDNIKDLIDLAYGGDFIADYVRVLEGRDLVRRTGPKRAAAVRFVSQQPGTVVEVAGVEAVAATAGVQEVHVSAQPGAHVEAPRSSWQRAGHVMVTSASATEAAELAGHLAGRICIVTKPDR